MNRPVAQPVALLEDDVVRVTRWNFAPGGETKWHRHEMDYVIVPMTECRMLLEEAEGERRVDMPAGAVYRRDEGVEHNVVNAGDQPMSFIEIEIKPRNALSQRERVAAQQPGEGLPKPKTTRSARSRRI